MPERSRRLALLVGIGAAVLAVAGNVYRRGLPDFIADWVALVVAAVAVGLAASIVFSWLWSRRALHRS